MVLRVNFLKGVNIPDYLVGGVKFDLKEITGRGKNVIDGNLKKAKLQAKNIVLKITKIALKDLDIIA
ncbi:MAG: hypothetical protein ACK5LM_01115 [Lactovum sp.]